jgi:uncharacterized protein (DUF169 family)
MMPNRLHDHAATLRSLLQLTAPPIAIAFHASLPARPERFDAAPPPPTDDGRATHGFLPHDDAATRGDVAAIVDAGWVEEADFAAIPAVTTPPAAVTYAPLAGAEHCDVVLVRLHAAGLMTLLDAWPGLRVEGKPQCHIVALAKERGEVAASVGCALSRARTGMPATEATAAIPEALLDPLVERLTRAATANATVARYAGADAARFASQP